MCLPLRTDFSGRSFAHRPYIWTLPDWGLFNMDELGTPRRESRKVCFTSTRVKMLSFFDRYLLCTYRGTSRSPLPSNCSSVSSGLVSRLVFVTRTHPWLACFLFSLSFGVLPNQSQLYTSVDETGNKFL